MRVPLPAVVLVFGVTSAHAQVQTAASTTAPSTAPVQAPADQPAEPPVSTIPSAAPAEEQHGPQLSARQEAAAAEQAQDEPKKRSRVLWILVGAVAVLGIVLAATL